MVTMFINLFVPNAPFLYTLKTENRKVLNFYSEQLQSHFQPKGGYILIGKYILGIAHVNKQRQSYIVP